MIGEWRPDHQRLWGADWSGVFIQACCACLDGRLGGVGGSAVLRAIRAVSSASRVRGQEL